MLYTTNSEFFLFGKKAGLWMSILVWIFDQSAPDNRGPLESHTHGIDIAPGLGSNDWLTNS